MAIPGQDAVQRFLENEVRLDDFLNVNGTYLDKFGNTVETLPSLVNTVAAMTLTSVFVGNWLTGHIYNRNEVAKFTDGYNYICKLAHTSGTFASDLAANKWQIYQNVLASDLISTEDFLGASLVGLKKLNANVANEQIFHKNRYYDIKTDFGAIGDGNSHLLSDVTFCANQNTTAWTLAQWQTIYPCATALSNELDWCAIQAAINVASALPIAPIIHAPSGHYKLHNTLTINAYGVSILADWLGSVWLVQNNPGNYSLSIVGTSTALTCQANFIANILFAGTSMGILLQNAEQPIIERCGFVGTIGVDCAPVANTCVIKPRITNCTFQNAGIGIRGGATRTADVIITQNYFIDCTAWGVSIAYCDGGHISNNAFFNQLSNGAGVGGMNLGNVPWTHICNNQFFNQNGSGLVLSTPIYCTISGNTFTGTGASANAAAISITQYATGYGIGNIITGNKFYRCYGPAISANYLSDSNILDNIVNGCGIGATFNGTVVGTTLTLITNAGPVFALGQALAVGTSLALQGVTIASLSSGSLGASGSVYTLSGTPSGGNVTNQPMASGSLAQDAFLITNCNEVSFDGNKVDGTAFTRYWLNNTSSINIRLGQNTFKNTIQADLYFSGTCTFYLEPNPVPASYAPTTTSLTPRSHETTLIVNGTGSGGQCYVNLVSAVVFPGKSITMVRTDAVNNLTFNPQGGQTINGAAILNLAAQWAKATIVAVNGNWVQVA